MKRKIRRTPPGHGSGHTPVAKSWPLQFPKHGAFHIKADSTLRSSQAVPHPSKNRALCRLTLEVRRDPVFSATAWPSARRQDFFVMIEDCHKTWVAVLKGIESNLRKSRCLGNGEPKLSIWRVFMGIHRRCARNGDLGILLFSQNIVLSSTWRKDICFASKMYF